jgi:phosphoglycerate dehydrogenase-like enzyme
VTDENALFEALRDYKIAGGAFDVFDKEPLSIDHPFLTLDNVILLPHIGGNTLEVEEHQTEILVPELEKLFNGEKPEIIVNPQVLETFKIRK